MSMYEIEALLSESVELWQRMPIDEASQAMVCTIRAIPDVCGLDAGAPSTTIPEHLHPGDIYEAGVATMKVAAQCDRADLIYDWCAFLLNFWSHMPEDDAYEGELIRARWFPSMRTLLERIDRGAQVPKHASLTLYPNGKSWFSEEHNAFIRSFFDTP